MSLHTIRLISVHMLQSGLSQEFVDQVAALSVDYEGFYDLMWLWNEETDALERAEIVDDLEECIADIKPWLK